MTTDTHTPAPLDYHKAIQILAALMESRDFNDEQLKLDITNVLDNGFVPGASQADPTSRDVWALVGWLGYSTDDDPFQLAAVLHREVEEFDFYND